MAAAGAVIALLFLAPYLVMVIGSFKPRAEILRVPPTYLPEQWRPDNYVTLWSTPETPLPLNLISTLVISVCATLLVLAVATPAAYYTARHRFPGRSVFLLAVLATQMLQPTVLAAGLFREFVVLGLNDTWFAMILVNAAFNLSFAVWIMHSFFAGIPLELEEAAALDGATRLQTLRRITLPLVWPGIVTAIIFTFVACWNEFAASLVILSTAANQPLSVALTKFIGQYDSAWQYVFAISVVAIVPVVLLFALIERRLVGGLTAGSIKSAALPGEQARADGRDRAQRWSELLGLLGDRGRLSVAEAALTLAVSEATIRRDFAALADQQLATRTHGGVVATGMAYDLPTRYRGRSDPDRGPAERKERIAAAAAALLEPGTVVGFNGGTTTTATARRLAARPDLQRADLPARTSATPGHHRGHQRAEHRHRDGAAPARAHGDPGRHRPPGSYELVGPLAALVLEELWLDVLVLGVDGFDAVAGATCRHGGRGRDRRAHGAPGPDG